MVAGAHLGNRILLLAIDHKKGITSGHRWLVGIAALLFILIAVIVIAALASSSKPGAGTSSHPAAADVTVTSCTVDAIGIPHTAGAIINHSSGLSDYTFTVSFLNKAGVQVAEGTSLEDNIAAHLTAAWTATGDNRATAPLTCWIVNVNRFATG